MRRRFVIPFSLVLALAAAPPAGAAELGSRLLREGSHGPDVRQLQRALRQLGFGLHVDGDYGPKTVRTIRRYERREHMKVDGIVGAREARKILRQAAAAHGPSTGGTAPPPPGSDPPDEPQDPPTPPPATAGHVFPVVGSFGFGSDGSRFGAPRGDHTHQGQDVAAAEGTPIVSVSAGTVYWRAYQAGGAGNYVVIRAGDGYDYVYMHMREGSTVKPGEKVTAGDLVGHVGTTGSSDGPHLHFEVWDGPWQAGGHPIDPLPLLRSWI
ncbi:MAG TPA: peptidoglycan DD-metalloendopeptidase family protein [Thermoleophilaceae bacterium]|nr:peptidoglycan DD-metalloendopeptidase family protein [Thermoleophilaceae bacterium]